MKRLLALACMITCVLGLTACGSEETLSDYEQQKADAAVESAVEEIIPVVLEFTDEARRQELADYTAEEIAYLLETDYGVTVDGYAFLTAVSSFDSGLDAIGSVTQIGEACAEPDDDQIIVTVQIQGENRDAEAEIIFSNDRFLELTSASLNPISTMGQLMGKAALNTVIGMGTVFVVLILICLIISCFSFIPKLQAKFSRGGNDAAVGVDKAVTQIVNREESVDETDDLELVAVIAAAVAASEGAASTDGFVVRSIRRIRR